ncbi:MAG: permease, partial [Syntrophus sp. (in: bacteria)]|nr:permease [Syntrophus sp. (in: bacteria)]
MKQFGGLVTGFSGGLLGGFVGIGGGIVMIPLMTHFLRLTQHQAHGTSLVAIIFTASIGAVTYATHGDVNW